MYTSVISIVSECISTDGQDCEPQKLIDLTSESKKSNNNIRRLTTPEDAIFVLVGNKIDLEEKRVVTKKEAEDFATEKGFLFYEVSAKTGEQIQELFESKIFPEMARKYHIGDEEGEGTNEGTHGQNDGGIKLNEGNQPEKKKGGCCGGGKNKKSQQVESQGNEGNDDGEEAPKESQGEE